MPRGDGAGGHDGDARPGKDAHGEPVQLRVEVTDIPFTCRCTRGEILTIPIKHGEGCYTADPNTLEEIEQNHQVVLRYVDAAGNPTRPR